ncbi:energy-coupling factor transport system ATP-binding protein [Bacillus pakistanensis]|uniref:Energy-coupling factor transport system ATP-binding protein n=1 Tax=Rossellomorea pakistanensis TaxID=992288 RepID=A0ABS2ND06_9BACI|nr:ATP-binding cassette domain-containing protein [Bacillus pakistanensis]MBM7585737.1 energy-coupling factor transport system ATP-binding protein [Bacillus pakistanensis]
MKVNNLRLKFPGHEKLLFKDLSLSVEKHEKVLLLGPSGCGKSTLLQVLSGVIPNSIEVPMKANEIKHPDSWGYVFQDPDSQFCMPFVDEELAFVLENLQVPREKMPERIKELLNEVGLQFDNLHTNINRLSGGMKQRLAIASVLALNPDTLFLDEPTALLDSKGTKDIWETVKRIGQDKTLIIVEHKLDHVLELIDRIILFDLDGNVLADGEKDKILNQYKETFQEQGIWYPGVWEDYLHATPPKTIETRDEAILTLQDFKGFHQKEAKISIPQASVNAGEWLAIVGENGAGKSTLLHGLMQFIKTSGLYLLYNNSVKPKQVPKDLTFVFQNPEFQFVTNSVFDEIAYSLRLEKVDEEQVTIKVDELLERFGLKNHREHHPYQLSMGQKRRLSVAASIVKNQPIMLLDEPTFGQDSQNTFALLEMLQGYQQKGATILMVTHDEKIVDHFATKVWTIKDGVLIQDEFVEDRSESSLRSVVL